MLLIPEAGKTIAITIKAVSVMGGGNISLLPGKPSTGQQEQDSGGDKSIILAYTGASDFFNF